MGIQLTVWVFLSQFKCPLLIFQLRKPLCVLIVLMERSIIPLWERKPKDLPLLNVFLHLIKTISFPLFFIKQKIQQLSSQNKLKENFFLRKPSFHSLDLSTSSTFQDHLLKVWHSTHWVFKATTTSLRLKNLRFIHTYLGMVNSS